MKAFVITRNRVTYTRLCVDALLAAGLGVIIVDHGSTWPPMLDWLSGIDRPRGTAVWGDRNWHPRDLWRAGGPIALNVRPGERFIVTDCDIMPDRDCPADWVGQLGQLLDEQPAARKAGLGLRTDDLPAHYARADEVREWERAFQNVADGGHLHHTVALDTAVWADIDTTLALYRNELRGVDPLSPEPFRLGPALRTRLPYVAQHLAWYEDSANPTPEQVFYRKRAQYGHWRNPDGYTDHHGIGEGV